MNDESLIEARQKTGETLSHFFKVWIVCILFTIGALVLSLFTDPCIFNKVFELLVVIHIFFIGVLCGCFVMYNIFWEKMETNWQKEKQKNENN